MQHKTFYDDWTGSLWIRAHKIFECTTEYIIICCLNVMDLICVFDILRNVQAAYCGGMVNDVTIVTTVVNINYDLN